MTPARRSSYHGSLSPPETPQHGAAIPIALGKHSGSYEPPDLIVVQFGESIAAEDVTEYARRRAELFAGQPHILTLLDMRALTDASPGARKAIAGLREPRPQATAILGASFRARVFAQLIVKAVHLVTGKLIILGFFDDEQAARGWLAEMRGRLRR